MYSQGTGVTQDYEKAKLYLKKAIESCESGVYNSSKKQLANAETMLGKCYHFSENANYGQAAYWYKKAVTKGEGEAQFLLGRLYHDGNGVEKDGNMALYWYEKALENSIDLSSIQQGRCSSLIKSLKEEGYSSSRASTTTTLSTPSTQTSQTPSGKIEKVWLEHNVYKNGEYGTNFHIHFHYQPRKIKNCHFLFLLN